MSGQLHWHCEETCGVHHRSRTARCPGVPADDRRVYRCWCTRHSGPAVRLPDVTEEAGS